MPKQNITRDRLDGTDKNSILYELFTLPGRIILWFKYMNPQKGYHSVSKSSRRARSPIMTFLYSLLFWVVAVFIAVVMLFSSENSNTIPDTQIQSGDYTQQ